MLTVTPKLNFKSDNVNFNPKSVTAPMPQDMTMPDDGFIMQNEALRKAEKKEKQNDTINKLMLITMMCIAIPMMGNFLKSIFSSLFKKGKVRSQAEEEIEKLTKATINWTDFKDKKDVVASLNSKTTSKVLRDAFNNIINGEKLSAKAKKWGGSNHNNTNMIYLYGHGGVGKTYVAEQYAQERGALFTSIKYPDMGSPFKDAASMKVSNTFDQIVEIASQNKERPVVVCIDEFDAVIKKVAENGHDNEAAKTRAAVLTGMDAVRKKCDNVTFIATSNYHPKNGQVDEIALRRFNNQIEVPLPDNEQIEGLLEMYLKKEGADAIDKTGFLKKPELKKFADKLYKEGFSNGEIELIVGEAMKIFRSTLKNAKDAELETKHAFKMDYLEQAMKMKGTPASRTNKLMIVKDDNKNSTYRISFWQRLKFLFGRY